MRAPEVSFHACACSSGRAAARLDSSWDSFQVPAGTSSGDRRSGLESVDRVVAPRAPHLSSSLRSFVLGAFAYLLRELDEGAQMPVAFVEHEHGGGPALYEYRPLVRAFV